MKKISHRNIEKLLNDKCFIHEVYPSVEKIIEKVRGNNIRLIYGETYDQFGITIDSLKYYFSISLLHESLEARGINVTSYIIIGDLHSVKNKIVKDKDLLFSEGARRLTFLNKIKTTFGLKSEPVLMSSLFNKPNFQARVEKIAPLFEKSEEIQHLAEKTVLQNRLSQEKKAGFRYALEEVALILNYDIKIGPPREKYFDQIADIIKTNTENKPFCGIYLKPTYPLGLNFDYFVCHPEIEEYGLTPYKAGSNKLQNQRIILGETNLIEAERLINNSFISNSPALPNPVLDIFTITCFAKIFIGKKPFAINYEKYNNNPVLLKNEAINYLKEYIFKPLNL